MMDDTVTCTSTQATGGSNWTLDFHAAIEEEPMDEDKLEKAIEDVTENIGDTTNTTDMPAEREVLRLLRMYQTRANIDAKRRDALCERISLRSEAVGKLVPVRIHAAALWLDVIGFVLLSVAALKYLFS